ncbi:hypothetical protein GCM10010094_48610 [Streptomyces flaveus]|uniref:Uncharacterized protein n=1 Tax=Streptomyces flaveus TaxID=66370 RepID=A0A917R0N4_9ACTN|nr:hypothetical protein GCM10010094_48610 [Streptomyces flaveus]
MTVPGLPLPCLNSGDAGGPPALEHLVAEFRLAQFHGLHAQLADLVGEATVLNGRHRAVTGHAQVRALQHPEAVAGDSVVVVRAGLATCPPSSPRGPCSTCHPEST